jgi:hypothetical protein
VRDTIDGMARPARTLATYEDILEAPDEVLAELSGSRGGGHRRAATR